MKLMKKALSVLISIILTMNIVPVYAQESAEEQQGIEWMEGEYIIKYASRVTTFSNDVAVASEENLRSQLNNVAEVEVIDNFENSQGDIISLVHIDSENYEQTIKELNELEEVEYAEPNYKIQAAESELFDNDWWMNGEHGIQLKKAQNITQGSSEVIVAIADSGIDVSHEDLSSGIFINTNELSDGIDNDENGYIDDINGWDFTDYEDEANNGNSSVYDDAEDDMHGTHIAGIIAAQSNNFGVTGIAPNIKILPLKILQNGVGSTFHAIKAIEYAELMGADIMNCSWGSIYYSVLLEAYMMESNMLFVCAAGNNGMDSLEYPVYPASFQLDNVISVAAIDNNGTIADFSNHGLNVDIAAPGDNIYSTVPENGYNFMSGTSAAAPFVTGVAALLKSKEMNITPNDIKERIIASSKENSVLKGTVRSDGLLNAYGALTISSALDDLPVGKYKSGNIQIADELYVMGGYSDNGYSKNIIKFNPITEEWENITDMPEAKADFGTALYDNKLYLFGGTDGNSKNSVDIYDIKNNTWENGMAVPDYLTGASIVQKGEYVYVIGGVNNNGYTNAVYQYSLTNNTWTQKNTLPYNIAYAKAVLYNENIYLFGGCNENECKDSIYCYSNSEDTWTEIGKMAVARKNFGITVYRDKIYSFGGNVSANIKDTILMTSDDLFIETSVNSVESFNPATKTSEKINNMQNANVGMNVATYNNEIYIVGGWNANPLAYTEKYFGTAYPKNIHTNMNDKTFRISWTSVWGADGYEIEVDGVVYPVTECFFTLENDTSQEHTVRVRTKKGESLSAWSELIYYKVNISLRDAQVIALNSETSGSFTSEGEIHWYKLNAEEAGILKVTLNGEQTPCYFDVQLCNFAGTPIVYGRENGDKKIIDNIAVTSYNYYIKVIASYLPDANGSYTLVCEFEPTDEKELPNRAFCTSVSLNDEEKASNTEYIEISEVTEPSELPEKMTKNSGITMSEIECSEITNIQKMDMSNEVAALSVMPRANYYDGQVEYLNISRGQYQDKYLTLPAIGGSYNTRAVIVIEPGNINEYQANWYNNTATSVKLAGYTTTINGRSVYVLTAWRSSPTSQVDVCFRVNHNTGNNVTCKVTYYIQHMPDTGLYNDDCGDTNNDVVGVSCPYLPAGNIQTGMIDHPFDFDCYRVSMGEDAKVSAVLVSPAGMSYSVDIIGGTSYGLMRSYTSDDNPRVSRSVVHASGGSTLYIRVSGNGINYSRFDQYKLYVYFRPLDSIGDFEINDSFDCADTQKSQVALKLGNNDDIATPINFTIDSPVDLDYYAVDLNAGDKLSVQIEMPEEYIDEDYRYRIEVHTPTLRTNTREEYDYITYRNIGSEYSQYMTYVAPETKTYYVVVTSKNEKGELINTKVGDATKNMMCTLRITKTDSADLDTYEVVDDVTEVCHTTNDFTKFKYTEGSLMRHYTTAQNITSSAVGSLDNELDVDWFKYESQGNETKWITLAGNENNDLALNSTIVIADNNGNVISTGSGGVHYTLPKNQTCFIGVLIEKPEDYQEVIGESGYTLSVNSGTNTVSDLRLSKKKGGSFIYVNHPEHITDEDIIQETTKEHEINRLIYHQENVSGFNTMYISHSVLEDCLIPSKNFYYDVDFYNPSDENITIILNTFCADVKTGYVSYSDLSNLYLEKLNSEKQTVEVVIHHGEHKLLFKDILGELFLVDVGDSAAYIGIFVDFKVETDKNITVSTLAAYDSQFLDLLTWNEEIYANAGENEEKIDLSTFFWDRFEEDDLNRKIKGIDRTATNEIIGILNYVIDDNTIDKLPKDENNRKYLQVNLKDEYYRDNIHNPKSIWITNINPFADGDFGRRMAMPSNLHAFEYNDTHNEKNGKWKFDFLHVNPFGTGNPAYAKEELEGDELNYLINNTMTDYFKNIVATNVNVEEMPNNILYENWENIAMTLGSWGVTYTYRINIENIGSEPKTLDYIMRLANFAAVSYNIWNRTDNISEGGNKIIISDMKEDGSDFTSTEKTVFSTVIEPGKSYSIRVNILNGVGVAGFDNKLILK